jgi:CheY-like chemotaxis protein
MAAPSILIVDDNPINLKLARLLLSSEGYLVETANDAGQMDEWLEQLAPALILMDLRLPGVDGLTLVRRLRADQRWNATWIVALTACAMKGDEERALAAGCDGYVTKPIVLDTLLAVVADLLARTRG